MSVMNIYETAPIGALVRYTDLSAQPPANDEEASAAWKQRNGAGRLVRRSPPRPDMIWSSSGTITLQPGDFPMNLEAAMASRRDFSLDSDLSFQLIERPVPGNVRILQEYGTNSILIYLAENRAAAERWLEESRHINARLEEVGVDEICSDFVKGRAARCATALKRKSSRSQARCGREGAAAIGRKREEWGRGEG